MRIRTIKPIFFLNDTLAECSPLARLFFIGLWCAADCEGRLEFRPKRLKAEILPFDDVCITELVAELEQKGFVITYHGDGSCILQVVTFRKHQRITGSEAEADSTLPPPPAKLETSVVSNVETSTVAMLDDRKEGRKEGKEGTCTHPPTHQRAGQKTIPTSAEQVVEWGKMDGVTEDQCTRFFNHFDSMGWTDRNGNPIINARRKLAVWAADDRARQSQPTNGKTQGSGISASMQASLDKTELERIEKQIGTVLNSYEAHQAMTPQDRGKIATLRVRRTELKERLGFKA
jgi:hypothetical protein